MRPSRAIPSVAPSLLPLAFIGLMLILPWLSAGDHALYPPDEGRYASCAREMAEGGSWLIPMRGGEPHLRKPPLAYWLQALSISILGPSNLAPRVPSLLAGNAVLLGTFLLGRRLFGARAGLLGATLLGAMPLVLAVTRLATIDSLLAGAWLAALAGGILAAETGRIRWAALLWGGVGAGLLLKGPVALLPALALLVWLVLGGRCSHVWRLRPIVGPILALLPVAAWALAVRAAVPDAIEIWRHEVVDRAVGGGEHSEPFWFFLPVLLVGFFPATAMLVLPMFNLGWRDAITRIRDGSPRAALLAAILVPLLVLSLNSGKLPTYILPLAPPLALLVGLTLDGWLSGAFDRPSSARRPPDVRWTVAIIVAAAAPVAVVGAVLLVPEARPWPVLFLLPALASVPLVLTWRRGPSMRALSLAGLVLAWQGAVLGGFETEDALRRRSDPRELLLRIEASTGRHAPQVLLYGFRDETVAYSAESSSAVVMRSTPMDAFETTPPRIVVADSRSWSTFESENPGEAARFRRVASGERWFHDGLEILEPIVPADAAPPLTSG